MLKKYFNWLLSCANFDILFFVLLVSITMYYDEEHSKLFTAFNQQVMSCFTFCRYTILFPFTRKFGLSIYSSPAQFMWIVRCKPYFF